MSTTVFAQAEPAFEQFSPRNENPPSPLSETLVFEDDPEDPLLKPNPMSVSLRPINVMYEQHWGMYKELEKLMWRADELDGLLEEDRKDWAKMTEAERNYVKNIMSLFLVADGQVKNLAALLLERIQVAECKQFYGMQCANEGVHQETYSNLWENVLTREEQASTVQDILVSPCVASKYQWVQKWIEAPNLSLAETLVAMVATEGVFFASNFCAFFYFKKRGMLRAMTDANRLISRDELLHGKYGALMYKTLRRRLPYERAAQIMREAVEVEIETVKENLPNTLQGLTQADMIQYVRFAGKIMFSLLGYDTPLYTENASNPFPWMDMLSNGQNVNNHFERHFNPNYQKFDSSALDESAFC